MYINGLWRHTKNIFFFSTSIPVNTYFHYQRIYQRDYARVFVLKFKNKEKNLWRKRKQISRQYHGISVTKTELFKLLFSYTYCTFFAFIYFVYERYTSEFTKQVLIHLLFNDTDMRMHTIYFFFLFCCIYKRHSHFTWIDWSKPAKVS